MTRTNLLPDELFRQLVAVGQVDLLVGVPTFNHAATIGPVITTLHTGLAKHFPRERTVIVNIDSGSEDGTREVLRSAPLAPDELRNLSTLRTTHRVSAVVPGGPGRSVASRAVFAAADLLQAQAVVFVDADVIGLHEDWVDLLARPVLAGRADLLLPCHPRRRFDGPLLSQLVRPLLGQAFARPLPSHLAGEFACTGRFAARRVSDALWEGDPPRHALDVRLLASALAEEQRIEDVLVGPRSFASRAPAPSLGDLFRDVVGAAFAGMEQHAGVWRTREASMPAVSDGPAWPLADDGSHGDPGPLEERFRSGVRDLAPLLAEILAPGTLAAVREIAARPGPLSVPDHLWVTLVYEFAVAAHRNVMNREHTIQVMVPLYLGRTASHFTEIASVDETEHRSRLKALEDEFARLRPMLLDRWNA